MLTPDECLSFLKMQMDRFLETDPDKQDEFGDPVETIARLSFDVSRGESLVEKDVRQINFDLYAETFRENHTVSSSPSCDGQNESVDGEQHEILRPSSCDGLANQISVIIFSVLLNIKTVISLLMIKKLAFIQLNRSRLRK